MFPANSYRTRLMETCGINDFSIRDLIRPDPGRTRRILSGIINFLCFRKEKEAIFRELCQSNVAKCFLWLGGHDGARTFASTEEI